MVTTSPDAPATNRTVVHQNTFVDGGVRGFTPAAIRVENAGVRAKHSVVITGNRFTLETSSNDAIRIIDTDDGIIQNNRFVGSMYCGVYIPSQTSTTGWSVLSNTFSNANAAEADVCLNPLTQGWVVNSTGANVRNEGQGNFVFSPGAQ